MQLKVRRPPHSRKKCTANHRCLRKKLGYCFVLNLWKLCIIYITMFVAQRYHNQKYSSNDGYHIVLIDFGKATTISQAKFYRLNVHEKHEYTIKYRHIAPEVIDGQQKQSVYSDMYSVGLVFYRVTDLCYLSQNKRKDLADFAQKCRPFKFYTRPKSSEALKFFENLTTDLDLDWFHEQLRNIRIHALYIIFQILN